MNRRLAAAAFCLCSAVLTACAPSDEMRVDIGELEDYMDFLVERDGEEAPVPFKAEPLYVSATGKVKAVPDIAVITAVISGEDENESLAVNTMSETINALQDALRDQSAETGFTAVTSKREFDEACLNHNNAARSRHAQINSDYWFNRRLNQRGDTETKRRAPKPRIEQRVCNAQTLKVSTRMVIRVRPAEAAGDVLKALGDAGAETSRLFGYDFSDYDALYQEAAQKAVTQARTRAENIAKIAGTELGELERFTVSRPARTGRFGPQPHIIRPQRPRPPSGSVVDRQVNEGGSPSGKKTCWDGSTARAGRACPSRPTAQQTCWDGSVIVGSGVCPSAARSDDIVVTGSRIARDGSPQNAPVYQTVTESVMVHEASTELITLPDGTTQERVIPAVTKQQTRRVIKSDSSAVRLESNTLSMSLFSGPQTITVNATLAYAYDSPLNGKVVMESTE